MARIGQNGQRSEREREGVKGRNKEIERGEAGERKRESKRDK